MPSLRRVGAHGPRVPDESGKVQREREGLRGSVGFKGKGKGMAKGGGDKGFGGGGKGGDIKGKGKGYQGTCWTCGVVGYRSSECLHHRPANAVEDDVGGAVSHVEVDVGGVWMIGAVEAKEIVEASPGLGGCGGQRRRIETSNRFEVLAREEDDWKLIPGRRARRTMMVDVGAVDDQGPKTGMSRECAMRFNVAKVQKPLASAAKVVEAGNRISMGPNPCDNYIENANTGERMSLRLARGEGTYVFDVEYRGGEHDTITLDSGAGVNVFPEELQKAVPMQPRHPRLHMTAAHGSTIWNMGTKIIRFRGREPRFTRPA